MTIQAGVARTSITPPLDTPNGMFVAQKHVRPEGLDMDLYATALVLEDGDLRIVLLDFDLCFLPDGISEAIRAEVETATGIPASHVLPFCSHSHAGPTVLANYHGEGEDRVQLYIRCLPQWAAAVAREACREVTPVRLDAGTGQSAIGVNRDLRLPDGRFLVGCNPDGFFDQEVGVIRIDKDDGRPLACIVNYACHPTVLGPKNKLISPDYPGHTRRQVEQVTGSCCIFLQGAAGNVGPRETFVGDARVARRLGSLLGLEAARVYLELKPIPTKTVLHGIIPSGAALAEYEEVPIEGPEPELRFVQSFVELPIRARFPEVYEKAPQRLSEWEHRLKQLQSQNAPEEEIASAVQIVTRERLRADRIHRYSKMQSLKVESHAIRLGNTAIVTLSGEPYNEVAAEIKARSPFPGKTLVAGYVGGDMMYIPIAEAYAFDPPPMEVDNSPYASPAARVATEHMVMLLKRIADQDKE
jgi:neutral ceramidase